MVERKNILIPIYTYICTLSAGRVCIPVIDVDMPHLRATRGTPVDARVRTLIESGFHQTKFTANLIWFWWHTPG